jgi:hypothetical protein
MGEAMTSIAKIADVAVRVLAMLCLYIGLALAARLLGVGMGSRNPLDMLGIVAFTYLAIFTLGYLFAAVGIWIGSAWGFVVAIGTAFAEIILAMVGDLSVRLSTMDFLLALAVLIVAAGLFVAVEIRPFLSLHN